MVRIAQALTVLVLAVMIGCGASKSPVVGTWEATTPGPNGETGTMVFVFNEDGTMVQTFKTAKGTLEMRGTYTAANGQITQILKSITSNGKTDTPKEEVRRDLLYVREDNTHLSIGQSNSEKITLTKVN